VYSLCDLFSPPSPSPTIAKAQEDLLIYYTLLNSARLDNAVLSQLPLPRILDPNVPAPIPSRLRTVWVLVLDTIASLLRLPFFLLPLLVHIPAYLAGRMGARLVEDEEETQAQNKVRYGCDVHSKFAAVLLVCPGCRSSSDFFLLLSYTPLFSSSFGLFFGYLLPASSSPP
jgi:hypothetical protein